MSAVRAVLTLIGFSAVIGQIVLMRELIVVFNGNEISLGIMLATWLFWTAAGSGLSSRFALGGNNARRAVAALDCLLGVSLPPTIWALRASRSFFQTVPGELVGPAPMLFTSLACLSLFCVVSGALFVVATRMYERECAVSARVATSSAYLLEAAGSAFGGILASIVLLRFLGSFQIATIVTLLNLCMAAVLLFQVSRKQLGAVTVAAALFAILLLVYVAPSLDRSAQARLWRGFRLVGSRDSVYGNLAVIETGSAETGNIRSIYDNGVILANAPDENAAEEAVHYALLEHPAPRQLLLIGGGVNGSIAQALKHPTVERIDYVELDPALIDMARQFFPVQSVPVVSDLRVHIHYADGRYYLKTAGDTFDVIILNVPDPQTAQLNRFYTAEFFRSARDHLASGGLLALQLRSSEDYISPDLAEFLRCIHHTLRTVFPYVVAVPGETIHLFAATRPDVLTDSPQTLIARLQERNLKTQYVREYFIPFRMMPDRMEQVRERLQQLTSTPVNRDFEPIAYYFDVVLWSTQFKLGYSRWFRAAAHIAFNGVIDAVLVVLLFVAVLLAFVPAREKRARCAAACCVAATGFTLMTLQILLLLAFQSVYGYVYHQLAILVAMCMAGIAFGSWLGIRRIRSSDSPPYPTIAATQVLLALSGPALIFAVGLLSRISGVATTWLAAQFVFPALAALCGMLGGYQFPIATEIYLHDSSGRSKLGTLYAIDLLGGCAGALLLSSYLIPVFGFWKTAWLSAAVNLAPVLLAARVSLVAKISRA
ncbi:MAG: fused MFS/spermidine synthase [Acidobacteriia bacterium]|nr:fused MFS/spermidine synthase [Terriglobia bacterium]